MIAYRRDSQYSIPEIRDRIAPDRASRTRCDDDGLAAPMLGRATPPLTFGTRRGGPLFMGGWTKVLAALGALVFLLEGCSDMEEAEPLKLNTSQGAVDKSAVAAQVATESEKKDAAADRSQKVISDMGDELLVTAVEDKLLAKYENPDRVFIKRDVGPYRVYRHIRTVGDVIVERDYINYRFEADTMKLVDKTMNWRPDVPEIIRPLLTQEQAEALVEGDVDFSKLLIISPESKVFRFKPTPENPCWVVSNIMDGNRRLSVIDAVTGELLGFGDPPPDVRSNTVIGPYDWYNYYSPPEFWDDLYQNAMSHFINMGYSATTNYYPTALQVRNRLQDTETSVFYEIAHSGTGYGEPENTSFLCGVNEKVTAQNVESWLVGRPQIPFAFLMSCFSSCITDQPHTLSYAFRKGSNVGAATVGGCGLSESHCFSCWNEMDLWQDYFFSRMTDGYNVQQALNAANSVYGSCADCMFLGGDGWVNVYPRIERPSGFPDLRVFRHIISPSNPDSDDLITFRAIVENIGHATAPRSTTQFRIGGETNATFSTPPLDPWERYTITRTATLRAQGYRNTVVADYYDNVNEEDEGNNILTASYTVVEAPKPDLRVLGHTMYPTNPDSDDLITFQVTIENIGEATSPQSTTQFRIGGETNATFSTPSLGPGDRYTITRTATLRAQRYRNTVVADYYNDVNEENEGNNTLTADYTVTSAN